MERGYQYRIYPNATQEKQLKTMFVAKRFVWNHFLRLNIDRFERKERVLTYGQMSSELTVLKKENEWLYQCEKSILQNTLKDHAKAYDRLFNGSMKYSDKTIQRAQRTGRKLTCYDLEGHPKFKSFRDTYQSCQMSYTNNNIQVLEREVQYTGTGKYKKQNCKIKLPKLKKIRIAYSRRYEGRILSATINMTPDNKYFVSLCCTDVTAVTYPSTGKAIGIDLGIKKFAATSNGEYIENPKYYAKYEVKLKKEQKKLSRRAKGGKNRCRQRMKVSRLHQKVKNCRDDFLHKLTTRLLKRYDIICIENLRVANMLKNHKLAKSIADASWSEFRQMLEYKADLRIKIIVVIDPFYPSSQICNRCDSRNQAVKDLKVRTWTCPVCHMYHPDRDFNSAINIRKEGLRILKAA